MSTPEAVPELIVERARVLRVAQDIAWVRCETQADCARCAAGQGCGGGLFARLLRGRLQELPVPLAAADVEPGDQILVGLSTAAVQNAAVVMYGLPLLGLLTGAITATLAGGNDLVALAGLSAGLAAGLLMARRIARRHAAGGRLQPVLLRKLGQNEPCPSVLQARQ